MRLALGLGHHLAYDDHNRATIYSLDCTTLVNILSYLNQQSIQRLSATSKTFYVVGYDYLEAVTSSRRRVRYRFFRDIAIRDTQALSLHGKDSISDLLPDVYDKILDLMDIFAIAQFRQSSRLHNSMVGGYFYERFLHIIAPFGLEGKQFLKLLKKTGAIVSGSAALLMLFPNSFVPGDLDIFVTATDALILSMEIIINYDYVFSQSIGFGPNAYPNTATIKAVHWLKHPTTDKKINIIVVTGTDALEAILHFNATHVMNFITSTGFASAYPDLTMSKNSLINVCGGTITNQPWSNKHRARGFKMRQNLSQISGFTHHQCTTDPSCPKTARHIRDAHMMFLEFKTDKRSMKHVLHHYEGNVSWGLEAGCRSHRGDSQRIWAAKKQGYVHVHE